MDRAEREELHAIPLGIDLAGAYLHRATRRNDVGKPDEAIEDFNEVLNLDCGNADAYCGKGAAYLKKTDYPRTGYRGTQRGDSPCTRFRHYAYCLRARANLAAGNYAQASEDARRAIHLDAKYGDAFLTLGSAILSSPNQQRDAAVKALMDAFRLYKAVPPPLGHDQALAYYNLSVSLDKAGETAAAKKAFHEARQLDPTKYAAIPPPDVPKQSDLKLVLANSLLTQKLFDDALAEFTGILLTDPKNVKALLGRGSAFWGRRIGIRPLGISTG